MKTKEYVKKYKLSESDKFNHADFCKDLEDDFNSLLTVGNTEVDIYSFNRAVNAVKVKFDAINNKTVGCIPITLWNFFYATVITPMKKKRFS